jgi:hypothetical protein
MRIAMLYDQTIHTGNVAQPIADALLDDALQLDRGRPADDISILVVAVLEGETDGVRRMSLTLPIPPLLRP